MFVEATTSIVNFSPCFVFKLYYKRSLSQVSVRCIGRAQDSNIVESADSVQVYGEPYDKRFESPSNVIHEKSRMKEKKLEPLWDDGFGTQSVKDYLDLAKQIIKPDGGPPRWFCPVVADGNDNPLPNSPVLLYLPGMDGLGLGLILHQTSLRKVFEVRCLHIPVHDRTPFEDLVKFVEETVRFEHGLFPSRPIYLVGDSFGGCLALAVAARNSTIDLVLILANPATSFDRTQLQPLLPILEVMPESLFSMTAIPYLASLLPRVSGLYDIIPKSSLSWKLKLLKSAAAYANSRLRAVKAEVLVLASGKDSMFPSTDEAQRLSGNLRNCKICYFKDNGHTILLEDGVNLLTVIKGNLKYRRSRKQDFVKDYLPPSMSEYKSALAGNGCFQFITSPVMFSTLEDGKIVKGLSGVPNEGPVLLVGYHMLLGLDLPPLILEFLREKKVILRGIAHPFVFTNNSINDLQEYSYSDLMKVFGALPVTPNNLFKLFSSKSFVLLYPGGAREALHRKGEEYKLFWPDQPEFVRMAAKFGATIVPFGSLGEDDLVELILDYDDIMKVPGLNNFIRNKNAEGLRIRNEIEGEVGNQDLYFPGLLPKVPGRFYYLFGKPIRTKGSEKLLKDKENAKELYMQIKSEVEKSVAYLIKKREEDPYRGVVQRVVNQHISTPVHQVPTFEP